jgi:hypothetical protein
MQSPQAEPSSYEKAQSLCTAFVAHVTRFEISHQMDEWQANQAKEWKDWTAKSTSKTLKERKGILAFQDPHNGSVDEPDMLVEGRGLEQRLSMKDWLTEFRNHVRKTVTSDTSSKEQKEAFELFRTIVSLFHVTS